MCTKKIYLVYMYYSEQTDTMPRLIDCIIPVTLAPAFNFLLKIGSNIGKELCSWFVNIFN